MSSHCRIVAFSFGAFACLVAGACSFGQPTQISPSDIPDLEARLAERPTDGNLLLTYAAALHSAGEFDSSAAVAERGSRLSPQNALGPLILGQCQERAGEVQRAIETYTDFIDDYAGASGIQAVRGRLTIARRAFAAEMARHALLMEDSLASEPADQNVVGVLPILVVGDSSYQSLSVGLAAMIVGDFGLIERFRMVERLQLQALMGELRLSQSDLIDSGSALRLGRLARAGRLVQGSASIPSDGSTVLEADVVLESGEVIGPVSVQGEFRDLIGLEKQLVFGIASQLGYQLTAAERERILENGTQSLAAFLAYADGLAAEEVGDYAAATLHFGRALAEDPGFSAANQRQDATAGADMVEQPGATPLGEVTGTVEQPAAASSLENALNGAVSDVSGTQSEQATADAAGSTASTQEAGQSNTANPQPTVTNFFRRIIVNLRIRIP